ncbi:MAG: chromosomal replication initiator protein DnaA [Planctomycetota bacterium]
MSVQTADLPVAQTLQDQLAQRIGDAKFQRWFAAAHFDTDDRQLQITVPTRFVSDFITRHFFTTLKQLTHQHLGDKATVGIQIGVNPAPAPPPSAPTTPESTPLTSQASATPTPTIPDTLNPAAPPRTRATLPIAVKRHLRYNLQDFVVGPSNELAYAAACRLADGVDCDAMSPLFVHSACGMGKTHLLQGLCNRYASLHPNARWAYTTAEQFTNQYITAVRTNKIGEFRRKLRSLDLLAVDDVHFFANKTSTQQEFLHTFNAMDLQGAKLVLASDAHPKQIEQLVESLSSRFLSGMVVHIDPPETETREQLIRALAKRRSLNILDTVVGELAQNTEGSVREIEGLITRLQALAALTRQSSQEHEPIGHALANRVIGQHAPAAEKRPVQLDHILHVVCETLTVDKRQILSPSRHRRVVIARSVTIYLARHFTTLSFPELAKKLARPNHSTIVTATKRVTEQIKNRQPLPEVGRSDTPTMDRLVTRLKRDVVRHANAA